MSAAAPIPFEAEPTPQGKQTLVPGVRPVSIYERLMVLAAHPMASDRLQRPCDIGLFDEVAQNQMDLFSTYKPKLTQE